MRYRLRIAADVWIQAGAIDAWWRANRAASPTLFRGELEAALERLEQAPFASAISRATWLARAVLQEKESRAPERMQA